MRTIIKHLFAGINAGILTLALTYLMYQMVKTEDPERLGAPISELPPITMQAEDLKQIALMQKPAKPIEAELAPPIEREAHGLKLGGNQLVLVLGYPPVYPDRHLTRGTEGFTVVGFSVDEIGHVFNAQIIESQPPGVFDRASLKAISKFKYKPRIQAGKAVSDARPSLQIFI